MRRDRIIEAVERLREALSVAQIREVLNILRNEPVAGSAGRIQKILSSYSIFSQHHIAFGAEEKQLMTLFGLDPLVNVNFWSSLLEADPNVSRKALTDVDVGVYNIMYVMPKLRDLLMREADKEDLVVHLDDGTERAVKRLRIMISEHGNELTETFVFTNVIKAVEEFYEVMFFLHKTDFVALTIGGIDSGDAKVIDFFGSADVIADMGAIIASVWQRLKHSTEKNVRYQVEVAIMGAGFVARLNEAQRTKALTEEDVQRITRTVSKSIEILLRSGAYTDAMDQVEDVRASDVLLRQAELIEYQAPPAQQAAKQEPAKKPSFLETGAGPFAVLASVSAKQRPN